MSLHNSFDRSQHLGELSTPLETQGSGVLTPALRRLATRINLFGDANGGIGYEAGQGGAVTQATSRTTGVTLSKLTGAITLFAAAPSTTPTRFVVTNTLVAANDVIAVSVQSANAANTYVVSVVAVAAGSFTIAVYSQAGTTSDSPVINFAVLKGAAA